MRLEWLQLLSNHIICTAKGITAVHKCMIRLTVLISIWLIIIIMLVVSKTSSIRSHYGRFAAKCTRGLMLFLLCSFQSLVTTMFTLVHCTQILESNVLYIQATIECYTYWQKLIMLYISINLIPFCFYVSFIPHFLQIGLISVSGFFLGCFFPMLCVLFIYCI